LKILVLDEEFPWPLNTGKRIRSYNLAAALAARHHVSYLAYGSDDSPAFRALAEAQLHPVAVPAPDRRKQGAGFYVRLLLNLFSPLPYIVSSHRSTAFQAAVDQQVKSGGFDMVICEWTPYAIFVRDFRRPKRVLVAHNIESHIWQRYEEHETQPLRRWYIARQRAKVQAFEKAAFGWVDGATAVSEGDAAEIRALGSRRPVTVVDNGVDTDYFKPGGGAGDPGKLVFTGSMDWRPNQDAAHWFVAEIWPRLRAARPALTCAFVGRDPPADVVELGRTPGITITGTVPDVRPMIGAAAAYVVPLRIGGGSRLKILEALAMGKAVISTRVGAEGLRLVDGQHLLLADRPEDFAATVLRVVDDAALRRRLGEAGRAQVLEHYRWTSIAARYLDFLQQVLEG
jgi:sugar transferase (PEP-CTERM/EpsH1 system associated)